MLWIIMCWPLRDYEIIWGGPYESLGISFLKVLVSGSCCELLSIIWAFLIKSEFTSEGNFSADSTAANSSWDTYCTRPWARLELSYALTVMLFSLYPIFSWLLSSIKMTSLVRFGAHNRLSWLVSSWSDLSYVRALFISTTILFVCCEPLCRPSVL